MRESSEGVRAPSVVAVAGAAGGVGAVGVATVGTYVMQREGERVRPPRQDTGFRDGDGVGGAVARVGVGVGGVGVVGVGCSGCMHRDPCGRPLCVCSLSGRLQSALMARVSMVALLLSLHASAALIMPLSAPAAKHQRPTPIHTRALGLRGGSGPSLSLASLGAAYSQSLAVRPIITKSLTASAIFALSDVVAQRITKDSDRTRTITSTLVGLFYFGPALHYWLQWITGLIPGFGVKATICKTLLGQSIFGPTITCVFFAASLISTMGLFDGLASLPSKIKQDLIVTWASGLCYWPFVDLICYSFVPVKWIPLSYNLASFFWTIYLSMQAAKGLSK